MWKLSRHSQVSLWDSEHSSFLWCSINQQGDRSCRCATTGLVNLRRSWPSFNSRPGEKMASFLSVPPGMTHEILTVVMWGRRRGDILRKNKWFKWTFSCSTMTVVLWHNASDVNPWLSSPPCATEQRGRHGVTVGQAMLLHREKTPNNQQDGENVWSDKE